jgi:hypothetical protein
MIAFLDCEASSLSTYSYPVEVGWVLEDGTGESHLIKPMPAWTDWDIESAAIHGITREMLAANGSPAADVARRLHQVLAGCDIHSDAPAADQIWLNVLMQTAGLVTPPVLDVYDAFRAVFRPMVTKLPLSVASGLAQSIVRQAESEIEHAGGVRHRAEPDARRHWMTWQRVKVLAAESMTDWPP